MENLVIVLLKFSFIMHIVHFVTGQAIYVLSTVLVK